ncbi:hypothetical protein D3C87_1481350 [compost metagenome]
MAGQGEHHVQVHARDGALRHVDRRAGLRGIVDAAQLLQLRIVKALDTQREARNAAGGIVAEAIGLGGAGVGLHGDLGVWPKVQTGAQHGQQFVQSGRRQQAGRAAPNEDGHHLPAPDGRQRLFKITAQGVQIRAFGDFSRRGMGIEVAIRAFAHAPRHMHING